MEDIRYDKNGVKRTLDELVRLEPEWAVGRIRFHESVEISLRATVSRQTNQINLQNKTIDELNARINNERSKLYSYENMFCCDGSQLTWMNGGESIKPIETRKLSDVFDEIHHLRLNNQILRDNNKKLMDGIDKGAVEMTKAIQSQRYA